VGLRLIIRAAFVAVVVAACAVGFVRATSASTTTAQTCAAFGRVKTLHGHVSMSINDTATGEAPGIAGTSTVSLARHATGVAVHLTKARVTVQPWSGFRGGAKGGSFVANDTLSFTDGGGKTQTGTLKANGASRAAAAALVVTGSCHYALVATFTNMAAYSGDVGNGYPRPVGGGLVTPGRPVPASLKLSGSASVIAEPVGGDCQILAGLGCATFSGGWADDYETLKECNAVVAERCTSVHNTDFTDAKISWSISPG
jgi:hypothetical protein